MLSKCATVSEVTQLLFAMNLVLEISCLLCHSMIISMIHVPTQEGDSRDLDSGQVQHKHPSVSLFQRISMTVHPRRHSW